MAFHSKLNPDRALEIYKLLDLQISAEAHSMYIANKLRAGQYKGNWYELQVLWLTDKIPTFHVTDCLRLGYVLDYSLDEAMDLYNYLEKNKDWLYTIVVLC